VVSARPGDKTPAEVWVFEGDHSRPRADDLATEEPLEIRLGTAAPPGGGNALRVLNPGDPHSRRPVAITMRTPGADFELAAGFLYTEGILRRREDLEAIGYCTHPGLPDDRRYNIVNVDLSSGARPDLKTLDRHFYTTSACGVCGKASLEALRIHGAPAIEPGPEVDAPVLLSLPHKLRSGQGVFSATGGLHAAALFDAEGQLLDVREDVGRHNAVDKLVGAAFLDGRLPLAGHIVMVSGRSSFEILQKCLMAGVPILCAVSAPSSLAVALAREFGITLVGFLRGDRFNVYSGVARIRAAAPQPVR
jgi:FdhD protein